MVWQFLTSWELWGAKGWPAKQTPAKTWHWRGVNAPCNSQHEIKSWIMNYSNSRWFTESFSSSSVQPNSSQNPQNSLFTPLKGKLLPLSSPLCWRKLVPCSDFSPFLESKKTQKKTPTNFWFTTPKKILQLPKAPKISKTSQQNPPKQNKSVSGWLVAIPQEKTKGISAGQKICVFPIKHGGGVHMFHSLLLASGKPQTKYSTTKKNCELLFVGLVCFKTTHADRLIGFYL